jgi:hypothetical protein
MTIKATNVTLISTRTIAPHDLWRYDPFLRPEWRWERVLKLVDRVPTPGRTTRRDDSYIRAARSFMLRWRSYGPERRDELLYENPGLYYAYKIHDKLGSDPEVRFIVEARLLTGQPYEEIADACNTLPETIDWYEKLFFNVRPMLRHHDWIVKNVLLPSADRYAPHDPDEDKPFANPAVVQPHLDMTLKFFSYFGGPILCEYMISGFKRGQIVRTQDDIMPFLSEQCMGSLTRRSSQAAMVFKIDRWNVTELFATHLRIQEIQKSAESQEDRRTTIERHIHAMLAELPWTTGEEAEKVYAGSEMIAYDKMAAELRDDELMLINAGQRPLGIEDVPGLVIPPPRGNGDKEVKADGKPQ